MDGSLLELPAYFIPVMFIIWITVEIVTYDPLRVTFMISLCKEEEEDCDAT